jgi:hypothetical protein
VGAAVHPAECLDAFLAAAVVDLPGEEPAIRFAVGQRGEMASEVGRVADRQIPVRLVALTRVLQPEPHVLVVELVEREPALLVRGDDHQRPGEPGQRSVDGVGVAGLVRARDNDDGALRFAQGVQPYPMVEFVARRPSRAAQGVVQERLVPALHAVHEPDDRDHWASSSLMNTKLSCRHPATTSAQSSPSSQ